jgi:hypothetical protein
MNSEAISSATHIDIDPTALQTCCETGAAARDAAMLFSLMVSGSF